MVARKHRNLIVYAVISTCFLLYVHSRLLVATANVTRVRDPDEWEPICPQNRTLDRNFTHPGPFGWDIRPCGECQWNFTTEKPIVAASLLVYQSTHYLARMLEALVETNTDGAQIVLFVFENQPGGPPRQVLEAQQHFPVVFVDRLPGDDPGNMGIVMPRIRIMQAMMAHGCRFQYFAEIHDDMSFFQPGWLSKLLAYDEPQVAILMPFIVLDAGGNDVHTTQRAMALAEARISGIDPEKNNTLYYDCIANHPWILKRSLIRTVGYYDSDYLWHEVEDNDFYYRVRKAGFHGLAIRSIWAVHAGFATRGILPKMLSANFEVFRTKHGMTVEESNGRVLNDCHAWGRFGDGASTSYNPDAGSLPHE